MAFRTVFARVYNLSVDVEFDPAKDKANRRKHGLSLARAEDFDLFSATTKIDDWKDYGEVRFRSVGAIDDRLHVLVFTLRGEKLRAISLRPANRQESRRYEESS